MSKQRISSSSQDLFFNASSFCQCGNLEETRSQLDSLLSVLSSQSRSTLCGSCSARARQSQGMGRFWCHPQHRVQPQKPAACAAQTHDSEKHVKIRTYTARVKQVFKSFVAAELFGGLFLFQTPGEGTCKETTRCWWHLSKVRVQIARMFMFASTTLFFFSKGC